MDNEGRWSSEGAKDGEWRHPYLLGQHRRSQIAQGDLKAAIVFVKLHLDGDQGRRTDRSRGRTSRRHDARRSEGDGRWDGGNLDREVYGWLSWLPTHTG